LLILLLLIKMTTVLCGLGEGGIFKSVISNKKTLKIDLEITNKNVTIIIKAPAQSSDINLTLKSNETAVINPNCSWKKISKDSVVSFSIEILNGLDECLNVTADKVTGVAIVKYGTHFKSKNINLKRKTPIFPLSDNFPDMSLKMGLVDGNLIDGLMENFIKTPPKIGSVYRLLIQILTHDTDLYINPNVNCYITTSSSDKNGIKLFTDGKLEKDFAQHLDGNDSNIPIVDLKKKILLTPIFPGVKFPDKSKVDFKCDVEVCKDNNCRSLSKS
ncbi:MAG: hypothetical protein MHPSP_000527, partial [Paramarteilia canceri]